MTSAFAEASFSLCGSRTNGPCAVAAGAARTANNPAKTKAKRCFIRWTLKTPRLYSTSLGHPPIPLQLHGNSDFDAARDRPAPVPRALQGVTGNLESATTDAAAASSVNASGPSGDDTVCDFPGLASAGRDSVC